MFKNELLTKKLGITFFMLLVSFFLSNNAQAGVIFEDNFDGFSSGWTPSISKTGWHVYPCNGGSCGSPGNYEPSIYPTADRNNNNSWNGWVNHHPDSQLSISTGEGRNGTPALKIGFAPGNEWVEDVGLVKWLGETRYQEIYLRYYFKYGDDWKWYNGTNKGSFLWKQFRVWPGVTLNNFNTPGHRYPLFSTTLSQEDNWGDPVVPRLAWGDYGSNSGPYMAHMVFHNDPDICYDECDGEACNILCDSQTCSSHNCQRYYWDSSAEGQVTSWCGPLNSDGTFKNEQDWHWVEYRIKYNSDENTQDGVFEVWLDGEKLDNPNIGGPMRATMPEAPDYGINLIVLNANQHNLTPYWDSHKYYYIDDVVISDSPIGPASNDSGVTYYCGDGYCNGAENCLDCPKDCGSCQYCGDGTCNNGETCSTCSSDCGACPVVEYCGDGTCNNGETCSSCAQDCGSCQTQSTQSNCEPLTTTIGTVVTVSSVSEFWNAINQANSSGGNMTILIEDGVYEIASTYRYPYIKASNLMIRSVSGNRDSVVLKGGGMREVSSTENVLALIGNNITVADLTIGEVGNHGLFTAGDNHLIHNVHIYNTQEQMVKGTASGDGSDNVEIRCSLFEYPSGQGPQYYIGGIDVHMGNDWHVYNNIFKNIKSPDSGLAEHAIHFWDNSGNNLIEGNKIINCDRGIGSGLGDSGNSGDIIRNNMIYTTRDVGIGIESSPNTKVYNNTIYTENYSNSIEYRFSTTTGVEIFNNLTNKVIKLRDGASAVLKNNVTDSQSTWFVNPTQGDMHLAYSISNVVDKGVTISSVIDDYDRESRPMGSAYDIGADEYGNGVIQEYCGDGTCNNGETCSTCSSDCGACQVENIAPTGYLDSVENGLVRGWAYDENVGSDPVLVHIYLDGQFLRSEQASYQRADLASVIGSTDHGFQYQIDTSNLSAGNHIINVYAINQPVGDNPELKNSPKTLTIENTVTEYCGDGTCNNGETCSTCSSDCGTCSINDDTTTGEEVNLVKKESIIASSNHYGIDNLWDSCLTGELECSSLSDDNSYWIEFDFGQTYNITKARLFGDANYDYISKTWRLDYKLNATDSYTEAFNYVDTYFNDWSIKTTDINARYVKVTVYNGGNTTGTQARELEIWGREISNEIPVIEYCGDGTCNNNETCSTCSSDCGTCTVVTNNEKLNYTFETLDSGKVHDNSNYNNDGNLIGATITEEGLEGKGVYFNGSAYIEVPHSNSLDITGDEITMMGWVYADDYAASNDMAIINKGDAVNKEVYFLGVNGEAELNIRLYLNGNQIRVDQGDVPEGQWVHIAATYDGSKLIGYINGNKVSEKAVSGNIDSSDNSLFIGRRYDYRRFVGKADNIKIYDRALSADEIANNVNITEPVTEYCGDGTCNNGETCSTCSNDCGACPVVEYCGDGECNSNESCLTCSTDCGVCPVTEYCGDGICNNGETCSTCSNDCGTCTVQVYCGDSICNGTETCSTCSQDCGTCVVTPICGNGECEVNETCTNCSKDCGVCVTNTEGIIFQDDFDGYGSGWTPSNDNASMFYYPGSRLSTYEPSTKAVSERDNTNSWNGWVRYGYNTLEINPDEGVDNSGALKIGYHPGDHQQQVGLLKWLGAEGYDELYIRWYFKIDDDWQWGDGTNGSFVYQKVMRLWQGIDLNNLDGKSPSGLYDFPDGQITFLWSEDNWAEFSPHISSVWHWDRYEGESSDYHRHVMKWSGDRPTGQLETYTGDLNSNGTFSQKQGWHWVEYHVKLRSSEDKDDGIFEVWLDGKKLESPFVSSSDYPNVTPYVHSEKSKMNWILLMDNGDGGDSWDSKRYWWVDNFAVSTEPIGPYNK